MSVSETGAAAVLVGVPGEPAFDAEIKVKVEVENALSARGLVFLFRERVGEKYQGYSPDVVASLWREKRAPFVLVEADGARCLPLKGYADYEPPLPGHFGWQMVVVGVDALLRPMNERAVARFEVLQRVLGVEKDETLTPPLLLALLTRTDLYLKNSPSSVKRVLCLNKADLASPDFLEPWVRFLRSGLAGYYYGIGVTGRNMQGSFWRLA
jgi:probable selenium-dependent hydroxylase accessory protein YqeC